MPSSLYRALSGSSAAQDTQQPALTPPASAGVGVGSKYSNHPLYADWAARNPGVVQAGFGDNAFENFISHAQKSPVHSALMGKDPYQNAAQAITQDKDVR